MKRAAPKSNPVLAKQRKADTNCQFHFHPNFINIAVTLIFSFTFAGVWGSMYGATEICFLIALIFVTAESRELDQKMKETPSENPANG